MKKFLAGLAAAVMLAVGTNAAFEKVNTYNNNFSDVKDSNWFADNVKSAYELGFMNGKSDNLFDPNGNVTVVEGLTMASRVHAIYNGNEITKSSKVVEEFSIGFNDASNIVDLTVLNSRNDAGISFNRANGEVRDGMLVVQPDAPNASGNYDPQITINGLELEAKNYNKINFRMKRDLLPNLNPDATRNETVQIYFKTSTSPSITADKVVYAKLSGIEDLTDWFEIEVTVANNASWKDVITGIRFDPTDNNGIYYIDYIKFSKSEEINTDKWYDMYVDYAVENGIVEKGKYTEDTYNRNITRAELCDLFIAALPEEHYAPINNIKGIPDVLRDSKNADVYLMLYNAGVLLGSDAEGTFNANSDVKRSEVAAIINRVALPENRVKGEISADWTKQGNEYDVEFNDASDLERAVPSDVDSAEIVNGALVIQAKDRGEDRTPRFDPKISVKNINIDADKYAKLKVRMKVDFIGEVDPNLAKFDFYFKTDGDEDLSEVKSMHQAFTEYSYLDPAGWYVMEVDFRLHKEWKGTITEFRFDPANTNGIYTIDYIRLAQADPLHGASHETLLAEGYTATRLMQDEHFERGFYVAKTDQTAGYLDHGLWQDYCETDEKPLWGIGPWWIGTGDGLTPTDLWDDRDTTTDKYTLADKNDIITVKYNPDEKSVSMRVNATNIYKGQPHYKDDKGTSDVDESNYKWWPHLLLEQQSGICSFDKVRNSAAADRMFVELDVRMTDFKDTTNQEGTNVCSYLIYFYLMTDKAPGQRIWFGQTVFNGLSASENVAASWAPDSAAHQYMYGIPQAAFFDGIKNSFNPEKGVAAVGDEWKHVRLDVTPHIERAIEWANRDNIFGVEVTKEDMYISGVNIGFEIHGNYDCTFEIKNFNMVAYDKAE